MAKAINIFWVSIMICFSYIMTTALFFTKQLTAIQDRKLNLLDSMINGALHNHEAYVHYTKLYEEEKLKQKVVLYQWDRVYFRILSRTDK